MRWSRPFAIRREGNVVFAIALLAFLLRIGFSYTIFPLIAEPLGLGRAPDGFDRLALNWVQGNGFSYSVGAEPTTYRGPGYPLLLAGLYLAFGETVHAGVIAQSLIGSLLGVAVYFLGKQLLDDRVGYAAALLVAFHPLLIWYSPRLRYEPLLALLLVLAVYWMVRAQRSRTTVDAVVVGLLFGYAALVNQVVLLLPAAVLAGLLLAGSHRESLAKLAGVAVLTMALVIGPWTIRNYLTTGLFIPVHSGGIVQFVKGNYEYKYYDEAPMRSKEIDHMGVAYVAQLLGEDPADFGLRATGVVTPSL